MNEIQADFHSNKKETITRRHIQRPLYDHISVRMPMVQCNVPTSHSQNDPPSNHCTTTSSRTCSNPMHHSQKHHKMNHRPISHLHRYHVPRRARRAMTHKYVILIELAQQNEVSAVHSPLLGDNVAETQKDPSPHRMTINNSHGETD